MNALRQIGFFADNSVLDKNLLESEEITHFEKFNGLFSCDSNFTIPFETGVKSVMIIGSTGSGKTASVILPMIKNCIKENMGGVILDVKGNLRAKVRAIADSYGRIDDIVEFGASETACKTNIIGAMEDHIVTDLFKTLCSYGMSRDGNGQFFYMSGAKICSDVYKCLNMLSESKKENKFLKQFTPTLYKIYQVISDRQMASGIWTLFMMEYERRKKYNIDLSNWQTLINDVKSNRFHLFKDAESYKNTDSSYEEQMAWNLNNMIRIFANIDQTHNILKNFSYDGEDAVDADFDKLVYKENKVVLIHFPIDCGMVGDILSKTIKEMYYTSVIKNGLNNKNITFMIADEFQDIMKAAGAFERIAENLVDAATSVSSCSPAYVFMFIEAMADAGVALGIPRDQALRLASKAVEGSAAMVYKTGKHPGALKDAVCSPGGSTIVGVEALEECGMRNAVIQAIERSARKNMSLGK